MIVGIDGVKIWVGDSEWECTVDIAAWAWRKKDPQLGNQKVGRLQH